MLKLKELLRITNSNVAIMKGIYPVIEIDNKFVVDDYLLSTKLLNSGIKKIDTYNNRIRIWLEEEEK